jgi:hypothetical protein
MDNEMFSVEIKKNYDVLSQRWETKIFLKLYLSMFRSGLVKELGSDRFAILMGIASYMDESGSCYPTQEQIADTLGISRVTANKRINSLLEFRWNDRPVIERLKIRNPKLSPNEFSVYTVLPLSQVAIFSGQIEDVDSEPAEATPVKPPAASDRKQLLDYFFDKYGETYSARPQIKGARDMAAIGRLLKQYSPEEVREMIDIVFQEYTIRWANRDFPRPTIGQLTSWLAPKAAEITADRRETIARYEQPGAAEAQDISEKLKRLRGES